MINKNKKPKKEKRIIKLTSYYTESEDSLVTEAATIEGDAKAVFSRKSTVKSAQIITRDYKNE